MTNFSRLERKPPLTRPGLPSRVRSGRDASALPTCPGMLTPMPWPPGLDGTVCRLSMTSRALAHAVPSLGGKDLMPLQHASPGNANRLVVAVGTGLGVAMLKTQNDGVQVFASEGGHTDFAPTDPADFRLLEYLRTRYGHISQERILSGRGLADLYRFVCDEQGTPPEDALLDADDPAAAINQRAESSQAPMAVAAIERFSALLGRFVGNAALFSAALGGVYLCGVSQRGCTPT